MTTTPPVTEPAGPNEPLVPAAPVVLEARDVAVHYGGIKAVDGVSFTLTAGRIVGILGPNGSGKSTLLGALTGLVRLTRGSLLLDGAEYHHTPTRTLAHRGLARTFQTVRLLPELTVAENVMVGADITGRRDRTARDRVAAAIEMAGLAGLERVRPDELSYGYQRRVEIARAIALRPQLIMLDEPTAGMNRDERADISALLRDLRSQGLTQLLVEHDVQMMVDTCDELLAMNFGLIIASGTPDEVTRDPAVKQAYLGERWSKDA